MTYIPNAWDVALATALIAGNFLLDLLFLVPLQRISSESIKFARRRAYFALIVFLWLAAACVCALWLIEKREWTLLSLSPSLSWRFAVGLALAGLCLVMIASQRAALLRRARSQPDRPISFGAALDALLPRTRREYRLFAQAAVAAGICEELLFRGFLLALLTSYFGLLIGAAASVALFGLAHAYQGLAGVLRTGAFGAVATIVVLGSGSLLPVIIAHVAIDLFAGDLGFRLLGDGRASSNTIQAGPIKGA